MGRLNSEDCGMMDETDALDPLTDEQRKMLDERFEAHRRAPETSIPWEEVRARLIALDRENP
jgi:putative addiction module component (TIGR02574 family)